MEDKEGNVINDRLNLSCCLPFRVQHSLTKPIDRPASELKARCKRKKPPRTIIGGRMNLIIGDFMFYSSNMRIWVSDRHISVDDCYLHER